MTIRICKVKEPWGWMGNMAPYPVVAEGWRWRTTEALFQALRFPVNSPVREALAAEPSPMAAKFIAKRHAAEMIVAPRSEADVAAMQRVVRIKVAQHAVTLALELAALRASGDILIVEDAGRRHGLSADFWGARLVDGVWVGHNKLGKLWMEMRDEMLRNLKS